MNPDLRIATIERILSLIDQKQTQYGDEGTINVRDYTDPTMLRSELDSIFRGHSIVVAHASEIAEPGSYVTVDIGEVPVLVNRDRDGVIHAFVNSCRHRGARLVTDCKGTAKAFKCPYHAWTYLDQGDLTQVPRQGAFPSLDRSACGLVRLTVQETGGFVWVTIGPEAEHAGDGQTELIEDLDHFGLSDHVVRVSDVERRATNWKLIMDAFSEGYHVKSLHQDSVRPFFLDDGTIFDRLGNHSRTVGARREIVAARETDPGSWDFRAWTTPFYTVFPNTILVFHPDWISRITVLPDGTDHSIVHHDMLVPGDADLTSTHWDKTFSLINDQVIQVEDIAMCEQIQSAARSGADSEWRLGGMETPVLWFHLACHRAVDEHAT